MSWSTSVSSCPPDEVIQRLRDEFKRANPTPSSEVLDQFDGALQALVILLPTVYPNVADGASYYFNVSISGHANKDHKKDPAWANDMVSISIYQQ